MTRWIAHCLVFLVALGAAGLSGYELLYSPAAKERDRLAHEVTVLQGKVRQLEATAAKEREFVDDFRRIEAEQTQLSRVVPQNADEQPYLRAFDAQARELGLVLASLRWGVRETRDLHAPAPFTLIVRGEPGRVLLFASRIIGGEPLVEVRSVELKDGSRPLAELALQAAAISAPREAQ